MQEKKEKPKTHRLLLGKTDQHLELSCSSHTPHPHLFLKVLLSISERRRGTIKNTFVRLNPKCPSTQNHNSVKPLFSSSNETSSRYRGRSAAHNFSQNSLCTDEKHCSRSHKFLQIHLDSSKFLHANRTVHVIASSFEYYRDQEVMDWLMFTCPNNYSNNNKAF